MNLRPAILLSVWLISVCAPRVNSQWSSTPPLITVQPSGQVVVTGTVANFSVAAVGASPLSYQWQFNGQNLLAGGRFDGTSSSNLVLSGVSTNDAGAYSVIVSNALGSLPSNPATLTVVAPLTNSWGTVFDNTSSNGGYLANWADELGNQVTLSTNSSNRFLTDCIIGYFADQSVTGAQSGQLRLYANDGNSGAPGTLLYASTTLPLPRAGNVDFDFRLNGLQVPDSFTWTFQVSGDPTNLPALRIFEPPAIGSSSATYWYKYQGNWRSGSVSDLHGHFAARFFAAAQSAFPYQTSPIPLTNIAVRPGWKVQFSAQATGAQPLGYQWALNNSTISNSSRISGATASTLAINTVQPSDAGYYLASAFNPVGIRRFVAGSLSVLPEPWWDADIGTVGFPGWASGDSNYFTVTGSGADIWGLHDGFHFVYLPTAGDCAIIARITQMGHTDPWSKAGVMVRESLSAGAKHALMAITLGNGTAFERRATTDGFSTHTSGNDTATTPFWVKLQRTGNAFTGSKSSDGSTWTPVGSDTITMSNSVYIGLALSAHQYGARNTAIIDQVQCLGGSQAPQILADPQGQALMAGGNANLTVGASGALPLAFQWRLNGTNLANNPRVSGALGNMLTISNAMTTDSGSYQVVISNASGAITSAVAGVSVLRTPPILAWPPPGSVTYGTLLSSNQFNAVASVPGSFTYTPKLGTLLTVNNNQALSVTFTPSDTNNYSVVMASALLNVLPVPLLVSAINTNRAYGATNPPLSILYAGFVNGEGPSALDSLPSAAASAVPGSPVGDYPIRLTGGSASNYTLSLANGILTVSSVPLTVTASNASRLQGEPNPAFGGTLTGVKNNDPITASFTTLATPASPPGSYAIVPYLTDPNGRLSNYTVTTNLGTLTVNSRSVANPDTVATVFGKPLTIFATNLLANDLVGSANPPGSLLRISTVSATSALGGSVVFSVGWTNLYVGPGFADLGVRIRADNAGNVYVTGYSADADRGYAFVTIKYLADGSPAWTNRFHASNHSSDVPKDLAVNDMGELFVTGYSESLETQSTTGGTRSWATIKYRADGALLWTNLSDGGELTALTLGVGGEVYVTGGAIEPHNGVGYQTMKILPGGSTAWVQHFNSTIYTMQPFGSAAAIAIDDKGNPIVTGSAPGAGTGQDFFTIKYSAMGTPLWTNQYNGPAYYDDVARSVAVDRAGNVFVTGESPSLNKDADYAIVKYLANGTPVWTNRYDGPSHGDDKPGGLLVDNRGQVYVTGISEGGITTIAYSNDGLLLWKNIYDHAEPAAMALDSGGNVCVTGSTHSGPPLFLTIKYSSDGTPAWTNTYAAGYARAITTDANGNVFVTGQGSPPTYLRTATYVTVKYTALQTPAIYYTPPAGFNGADTFTYTITDSLGAQSTGSVNVIVQNSPLIVRSPVARTNTVGTAATFSVVADGVQPLYYKWRLNGLDLADNNLVSGSQSDTLTISSVQLNDAGAYSVAVLNQFGVAISDSATLTVSPLPVLVSSPTNTVIRGGAVGILSVAAAGSGPLYYQWQVHGVSIPGATNATLTFTNIQVPMAGDYSGMARS